MFGSYCLQKFLNLCVSRTRKLSQFLFFTVITSSQGFASGLSSIVSLQDPLKCLKSSLQGAQWQVSVLFEKRKMSQNDHQLSLVVIHCHSLSPDVPLVVTRCAPRCHLLLLIAIRCSSLYHSMSLFVTRRITRLSFYKQSFGHSCNSYVCIFLDCIVISWKTEQIYAVDQKSSNRTEIAIEPIILGLQWNIVCPANT